ncbi:hypothetical protein [Fluviicoccus keumensis]|uniref:hypothetical protein n=1 Tax=Fluviicoccus keumensis TaxID=1435465 RepID=UPI00102B14A0|nr:hypothetical protein [Fluviicoccus keumensis]
MWPNEIDKQKTDSKMRPWWPNEQTAQYYYALFVLIVGLGLVRGCLRHRGYDYYPELVRLSAHLNRGGAKIAHTESIMKGTTVWIGNSVESIHQPNEMFNVYLRNFNKHEWILAYKGRDEYIFCKGEINLKVKYRGSSFSLKTRETLFKYSEDFQWPDWGGHCKQH